MTESARRVSFGPVEVLNYSSVTACMDAFTTSEDNPTDAVLVDVPLLTCSAYKEAEALEEASYDMEDKEAEEDLAVFYTFLENNEARRSRKSVAATSLQKCISFSAPASSSLSRRRSGE
mmetsp:Transcript_14928/g.34023  ORF Transcript_14928/g.34023 Transcript_14928/m.34023 type:complete len:119 (+) Transcript_14928:104-460(+)